MNELMTFLLQKSNLSCHDLEWQISYSCMSWIARMKRVEGLRKPHQYIYLTPLMMLRFITRISSSPLLSRSFATANTRDRINYYNILEVQTGATEEAIRKAYSELTEGLVPEKDTKKWKMLNEAFVILTDNKTRDAYDSLLSVRKTNYLSGEKTNVPRPKSYLANRKADKLEELKKKMNIDEIGRYKGGLPNKKGQLRGSARGPPGQMVGQTQIEEELDNHPEYHSISAEKAESFKNFHQDEREARTMKWPWFSFQVDYEFLRFSHFRRRTWPLIKLALLVFYIVPAFFFALDDLRKEWRVEEIQRRAKLRGQ